MHVATPSRRASWLRNPGCVAPGKSGPLPPSHGRGVSSPLPLRTRRVLLGEVLSPVIQQRREIGSTSGPRGALRSEPEDAPVRGQILSAGWRYQSRAPPPARDCLPPPALLGSTGSASGLPWRAGRWASSGRHRHRRTGAWYLRPLPPSLPPCLSHPLPPSLPPSVLSPSLSPSLRLPLRFFNPM
jgi:hypothetical protein